MHLYGMNFSYNFESHMRQAIILDVRNERHQNAFGYYVRILFLPELKKYLQYYDWINVQIQNSKKEKLKHRLSGKHINFENYFFTFFEFHNVHKHQPQESPVGGPQEPNNLKLLKKSPHQHTIKHYFNVLDRLLFESKQISSWQVSKMGGSRWICHW